MTMTPTWTLGDRLRKARETAGLHQDEVAAALQERGFKASRTTVGSWESDAAQPRRMIQLIEAWAEITDVDSVWLLTGAEVKIRRFRPATVVAA